MENMRNFTEKDGFKFTSIHGYSGALLNHEAILINNNDIKRQVEYINQKNLENVVIYLFGSGIEDLNFLKEIPHIKHLMVFSDGNRDFSPLYYLTELIGLTLNNASELSLEPFKKLELFDSDKIHLIKDIDKAISLKTLSMADVLHEMKIEDLSFLSNLTNLDTVSIEGLKIKTLKGIENLKRLRVLYLAGLPYLDSLTPLTEHRDTLTSLAIFRCRKLFDLTPIETLSRLQFLKFEYMSKMDHIHFINGLKNLKTFICDSCNIMDGNLSSLLNLEYVGIYPNRKHYYVIKSGKEVRVTLFNTFKRNIRVTGYEDIELWRQFSL